MLQIGLAESEPLEVGINRHSEPLLSPQHEDTHYSEFPRNGCLHLDCEKVTANFQSHLSKNLDKKERARQHLIEQINKKAMTVSRSCSNATPDLQLSSHKGRKRAYTGNSGRFRECSFSLPVFDMKHQGLNTGHRKQPPETNSPKIKGSKQFPKIPETSSSSPGHPELEFLKESKHPGVQPEKTSVTGIFWDEDFKNMFNHKIVQQDDSGKFSDLYRNPCITWHRPLTPTLIEQLNKLKLSSRKKTELWINHLPAGRHHSGNVVSYLSDPNNATMNSTEASQMLWLYDKT